MPSGHLVFLVEEPSMEAFLQLFLPRQIPEDVSFEVHASQCKSDLLSNLERRLLGYSRWIPENYRIFVLVDRDDDDCFALKESLERTTFSAGLSSKSSSRHKNWQVVNRVVIEELEAWYFGDRNAIIAAYPRVKPSSLRNARYRDPDAIAGGTWEAFERLLQKRGYFKGGLRKKEAARNMAALLVPERNSSRSFQVFYGALIEAIS